MTGWWLLMAMGCGAPAALHPTARLSWDFEANPASGVVAVLPWVDLTDPIEVRRDTWVFGDVGTRRAVLRTWRTEEVGLVPDAVADAIPGAMYAAVDDLDVRFLPEKWPLGVRERVEAVLRRRGDVTGALADVAAALGTDAVLVTWFEDLEGAPLTAEVLPGEIVRTEVGPVLVEFRDEPYRVTGRIGFAWVDARGDLVVRYEDRFEDVLTGDREPDDVGRRVARLFAGEVAKVFPVAASFPAPSEPAPAAPEPKPMLVGRGAAP